MKARHRLLTPDEARKFYDRFGAKQDFQGFYERSALNDLIKNFAPDRAHSVLEFGCGTGRFGADLLSTQLPPTAEYLGLDISATMVELARERIRPFGSRANIQQTDGSLKIDAPDDTFDRVVANYLLDLLSESDIETLTQEMYRVLKPGGLLGIVSLTSGTSGLPRIVSAIWRTVHRMSPSLVGGCRPIDVAAFLLHPWWKVLHRHIVTSFAIASEIVVAEKMGSG